MRPQEVQAPDRSEAEKSVREELFALQASVIPVLPKAQSESLGTGQKLVTAWVWLTCKIGYRRELELKLKYKCVGNLRMSAHQGCSVEETPKVK